MSEAILEISNLAVERRGVRILRDVSLSVPRGSSVGVVGETGSGKSMTCRAVTGMLARIDAHVTQGTVTFDGSDLLSSSSSQWSQLRRHSIGFVPQASIGGLDPVRRIGGQLRETVALTHPGTQVDGRVRELMQSVRLPADPGFLRRYPHELSGGQRQRVMIALALAGHPRLLLADEPTTALDVTVQREILALLATLRRDLDMALLLVSHDLRVVNAMCDWVVVMYAGITVESGPARTVLAAPAHPYTRSLLAAHPDATRRGERLLSIPGAPPDAGDAHVGCPFAPRCPDVRDACAERALPVHVLGPTHHVACQRAEELAR